MSENYSKPTFKFCLMKDVKHDKQFLPKQAEDLATGYDVRAALRLNQSTFKNFDGSIQMKIEPFSYAKIPLGIKCFSPEGWGLDLRSRSSTFANKKCVSLYGTIDESYEGEMLFCIKYDPSPLMIDANGKEIYEPLYISYGDPIAQLIPKKREEMNVMEIDDESFESLSKSRNSSRKANGFGSTG